MRYFTPEMWAGWQSEAAGDRWHGYLREAKQAYLQQLPPLLKRLGATAGGFFDTERHALHDGVLQDCRLDNFSFRRPPEAVLIVDVSGTGRQERTSYRYELRYRNVTRFACIQPTGDEAGFAGGMVHWGYDELTDAGDGRLRHEILFDSFATLEIVFEGFSWHRQPLRDGEGAGEA